MDEAKKLASQLEPVLATFPGVRVAFLFGSQVTGKPRRDSDVDLAVAFDPVLSEDARIQLQLEVIEAVTRLLGAVGERLDIADLDRANSAVAFRAVRDGLVVHARSRRDRVEVVAAVCARASDDEYYRKRAEALAKARLLASAQ